MTVNFELPADQAANLESLLNLYGQAFVMMTRKPGGETESIVLAPGDVMTAHVREARYLRGEPPKDGRAYNTVMQVPVRWKAYKPTSQQARHGIPGRWQQMNEFGGWENAGGAGRHFPFAGYFEEERTK